MRKYFFHVLAVLTLLAFVSCENFLGGIDLKEEIESKIDYANASSISVIVQPEEGSGTADPAGSCSVKMGYGFSVRFVENPEYSFIKWKAVDKDNNNLEIESGVTFENASALETKFTVTSKLSNIRILPECVKRLALVGEPSPKYESKGVGRDTPILVTFTKSPAKNSFIFSETEIPSAAEKVINDKGEIYAYKLEGQTYFKNISITNAGNISLANHFLQPVVEGTLLKIDVDSTNPIQIETGVTYETITVSLSKKITDELGIEMAGSKDSDVAKEWRYQISRETGAKAKVTLGCDAVTGNVKAAGTAEYSIGQEIPLVFTENKDYQFLRWECDDDSAIYISEPENPSSSAIIRAKADSVEIKAVCAERLRVVSISPSNEDVKPKNTTIEITFNHDIPTDDENIGQLENISIAVGGSLVKSSYFAPAVIGNKIIFTANKSNMIDVPNGQTKTVTVTVPADFYYLTSNNEKVIYGGSGKTYDFRIDETTQDKAEIIFGAEKSGSGTVSVSKEGPYSIGQEVTITFDLKSGWQFNGWSIIDSTGNEVDESLICIADKTAISTKLYVYDTLTGIKVKAICSEKLAVVSCSPNATVNPKDSEIEITFNKELDAGCEQLLSAVEITMDNISCLTNFKDISIDGKKLKIKNTSYLNFDETEKIINVTIPKGLYYIDGDEKIILSENYVYSYKINNVTTKKSEVSFQIIDGETGNSFTSSENPGSINHSYEELNIGEKISVSFAVEKGYQFTGWQLVDNFGNNITNNVLKLSSATDNTVTLTAASPVENACLKAVCYKRPTIQLTNIHPYSANTADEFAKNENITIMFDHAIAEGCENAIEIGYSGKNFVKGNYYSTSLDGNKVTFSSIKMLELSSSSEIVTVNIPHDKIYYLANNGKTKIFLDDEDDFSWNFRINNKTLTNTTIRFIVDEDSDSDVTQVKINNALLSTGTSDTYNIEQELDVVYPLKDGYIFDGWKVDSATTTVYEVEPEGYVKSGTITVKKDSEVYFKLFIPESDSPEKAKATILGAIGNGVNQYGLTISAKDILIPKIENITPEYKSEGVRCDELVKLKFNKAIDVETVTLGTSGSIQIVNVNNEAQHYENYFTVYSFVDNLLIIKPNSEIKNIVAGGMETLKIKIISSKIKDLKGLCLNNGESDESHVYRINSDMETEKPVVTMTLEKPVYSYGTATMNRTTLKTGSNYTDSSFATNNHIKNAVSLTVNVSDKKEVDSGFYKLTINETLIEKTDGVEVNIPCNPVILYRSSFIKNSNEQYLISNKTVSLQSSDDGVVKLDFIYEDYAENQTVVTYYVIKDTAVDKTNIKPILPSASPTRISSISYTNDYGNTTYPCSYPASDFVRTANSNGLDTVTFNCTGLTDAFYKKSGSNQNDTLKMKVYWGYSEESCTTEVTGTNEKYTFARDEKKNTYVKFVAYDSVGNSNEIVRVIPMKTAITGIAPVNGYGPFIATSNYNVLSARCADYAGASYYGMYILFKPESITDTSTYANNYKTVTNNYSYLIDASNYDQIFNSMFVVNSVPDAKKNTKEMYKFPAGTYKVYCIPAFRYGLEKDYIYGTISDYYLVNISYDSEKQLNIVSENGHNEGSSSTVQSYLPDSFTVSKQQLGLNSGKHKITVVFNKKTTNSAYKYYIKCWPKTSSTNSFITSPVSGDSLKTSPAYYENNTFEVNSGFTYYIDIEIRYSNGKYYKITGNPKEVDCTYDNIPPKFSLTKYLHARNTAYTNKCAKMYYQKGNANTYPLDAQMADKSKNNLSNIYYWVLKNPINADYAVEYTNEELENTYISNRKRADISKYLDPNTNGSTADLFEISKKPIYFPYDKIFDEGFYTIAVKVMDVNGNYTLVNWPLHNFTVNKDISLSVSNDGKELIVDKPSDMYNFTYAVDLYKDGEFEPSLYSKNYDDNVHTSTPITIDSYFTGKFAKVIVQGTETSKSNSKPGFLNVAYIYTDYYKTAITCNNKNVIPGYNHSYQVYTDNPIFMHTMWHPENLGSNYAYWETKGAEAKIVNSNSTTKRDFTYTVDETVVPKGNYYMVVAHFADGTVIMSDVKKYE